MSVKQNQENGKVKNGEKSVQVPDEWLYFLPGEATVRTLADALEKEGYELEIWEEAGVLEVTVGEGASMDIEEAQIPPKDTLTKRFAEEHGCSTVFVVTFCAEHFENAKGVMNCLMHAQKGLFCGDTEDFTPVIKE